MPAVCDHTGHSRITAMPIEPDRTKLQWLQRRRFEPTTEVPERDTLDWFVRRETAPPSIAETYHEATKYRERQPTHDNSLGEFVTDETLQLLLSTLPPEKSGTETMELPDPVDLSMELDEALLRRRSRRTFGGEPLSLSELGTLLGLSCGQTATEVKLDEIEQPLRAHPSAGGLYPVNTYVLSMQETDEFQHGCYWYDPISHRLERQRVGDASFTELVAEAFAPGRDVIAPLETAGILVLTGVSVRSMAKYGPEGYRYVLQESGHLAQNVLLLAAAMGLHACPIAAYDDDRLNELLDVDGVDEAAIYAVPIGRSPEESDD